MLPTLLRGIWIWEVENADIGLWFYAQRTCPFEWFQLQSDYSHIMEGNLISAPRKASRASIGAIFIKPVWNVSMSAISVLPQLHPSAPPKVWASLSGQLVREMRLTLAPAKGQHLCLIPVILKDGDLPIWVCDF